ncbi:MAG: helix-turn-helix domain-containing protein [Candidatus Solibacter usitatus]|nr:helix-turn-helix domain-containing protein [Candidatus Solibacter usitatus]
MRVVNHLAALRLKRGLSAADLAAGAGITRQTVYAVEAGNYVPNTLVALRLAQTLGVAVEDLFLLEQPERTPARRQEVELLPGDAESRPGQPVQLCRVNRRLLAVAASPISWRLPAADAVMTEPSAGKAAVQTLLEEDGLRNRLLVAGCDPGISVLAKHLRLAGVEVIAANRNSSQALDLLRRGLVHVAGTHLRDEASGESNLPAVGKLFPRGSAAVVSLALWEEGLLVARGNPKHIHGVEDLARKGITLINREPGAGSRILLDRALGRLGIDARHVAGYDQLAHGHLPAAWRVRNGDGDCCVATRTVARAAGLDFIPLASERYDLVMRKRQLSLPAIQQLLETLNRSAFRRELEELGGYDASQAGARLS